MATDDEPSPGQQTLEAFSAPTDTADSDTDTHVTDCGADGDTTSANDDDGDDGDAGVESDAVARRVDVAVPAFDPDARELASGTRWVGQVELPQCWAERVPPAWGWIRPSDVLPPRPRPQSRLLAVCVGPAMVEPPMGRPYDPDRDDRDGWGAVCLWTWPVRDGWLCTVDLPTGTREDHGIAAGGPTQAWRTLQQTIWESSGWVVQPL